MHEQHAEFHPEGGRRASPRAVLEARAAISLVKPFLGRLAEWQLEAAHLRAKIAARQSSPAEQEAARQRLLLLQAEARVTLGELVAQVPPGEHHSRIEDTRRALERFADMVAP